MLPADLNELDPSHIQRLIESEVAESLTLEYKEQLRGKKERDGKDPDGKTEFLFDVAAMANAAGGDLIYGIRDRRGADKQSTGIADGFSKLELNNPQAEITSLTNLIRACIEPQLSRVKMRALNTPEGDILVIRIPRSWTRPHMVTRNHTNKFYTRHATGKALMSLDEIRRAFAERGELRETIAKWREHRVSLIEQKRGPVPLSNDVAMLFHVIPADAFTPGNFSEAWRVKEAEKKGVFVPYGNYYQQYNADGFLCHSNRAGVGPNQASVGFYGFTQIFRSGIVEYAFSHFFRPPLDLPEPFILGQEVERALIQCYADAIGRYRREGRTGTAYVGFSMVGIMNKRIFASLMRWGSGEYGIQQMTFTSPKF